LLTTTPEAVSVHRLVQAVTRERLSPEEQREYAAAAVELVNEAFRFDEDDPGTWKECERLTPHGLAAVAHAEEREEAGASASRLLNAIALYLRSRADYQDARRHLERALQIAERVYGPDHP